MCLEDRELNQSRSQPDPVDRNVRTDRATVHRYNSTQYCSTEKVNIHLLPDQHQ